MPLPPRRGKPRSFTSAELRGTLGTLLRTTLAQAGVVKDALERGAREGRARLDDVRHGRRRHDALAALGERVLELMRDGHHLELADDRAVAEAIAQVEACDAEDEAAHEPPRARGRGGRDRDEVGDRDVEPGVDWIEPVSRSRFDRASSPSPAQARGGDEDERGDTDGAVSSRQWTPPRPRNPDQRVWRPTDATPAEAPPRRSEPARVEPRPGPDPRPVSARPAPARPAPARPTFPDASGTRPAARAAEPHPDADPPRRGGIVFEPTDDESTSAEDDLSEYMHPDDVPRPGGSGRGAAG